MTKHVAIALLAAAGLVGLADSALAQSRARCPGNEGRLSNGVCVSVALAQMRERTVCMTQGKINVVLGCPVLPYRDGIYPGTSEWNRYELGQRGVFSTAPFPRSP